MKRTHTYYILHSCLESSRFTQINIFSRAIISLICDASNKIVAQDVLLPHQSDTNVWCCRLLNHTPWQAETDECDGWWTCLLRTTLAADEYVLQGFGRLLRKRAVEGKAWTNTRREATLYQSITLDRQHGTVQPCIYCRAKQAHLMKAGKFERHRLAHGSAIVAV